MIPTLTLKPVCHHIAFWEAKQIYIYCFQTVKLIDIVSFSVLKVPLFIEENSISSYSYDAFLLNSAVSVKVLCTL